jgi:hypothetical protein
MGIHAYNDFRNNWDNGPYKEEFRGKLDHFRENKLLVPGVYDLRDMPIAITELGLSSAPSDAFTERSEEIQAYYPAQILARAKAEGLVAVLWFVGKDRFTGACENIYAWQTFGLLRSKKVFDEAALCPENPIPSYTVSVDNQAKPAHLAYKTAMEQLAGRSLDAELDAAQTGSVEIEAYRFKDASNAHLIVAFTDSGERLGRITPPLPVTRTMTFDASLLPGWTDRIAIVDHLGAVSFKDGVTIEVVLEQSPVFVRPD